MLVKSYLRFLFAVLHKILVIPIKIGLYGKAPTHCVSAQYVNKSYHPKSIHRQNQYQLLQSSRSLHSKMNEWFSCQGKSSRKVTSSLVDISHLRRNFTHLMMNFDIQRQTKLTFYDELLNMNLAAVVQWLSSRTSNLH